MQTTNQIERRVVEASLNRAKQLVLTQAWLGKAVGLRFAQGALSELNALLHSTGPTFAANQDDSFGGYQPLAGFEAAWACFPIDAKNLSLAEVQQFLALHGVELSCDAFANMQNDGVTKFKGREVAPVNLNNEHGAARTDLNDGAGLHDASCIETGIVLQGGAA